MGSGGNLEREIRYGNHPSADLFADEVVVEVREGMAKDEAVVFPLERAGN